MLPRNLLLLLGALGLVLTLTVVPGVFTVDEDHQLVSVLALADGGLAVANTDGLPPSRALRYFDPAGYGRRVDSTPVTPNVPPLYAPLALPFLGLGWRGLVALNTLAYLAVLALVFVLARRSGDDPALPWFAVLVYLVAGHTLEYAQGVWPHATSIALTTGALVAVDRSLDPAARRRFALAALGGLLAGVAAGVRYQNVVFAAALGGAAFLLAGRRRWRSSAAFGAGLAVPLALSSFLNHLRLGSWNPVSKGPGYFSSGGVDRQVNRLVDALHTAWFRIVDYSARPPLQPTQGTPMAPDPDSGAYVIYSAVKKAWLQSSPWLAVGLVVLVGAWVWGHRAVAVGRVDEATLRRLRLIALAVGGVIFVFAAVGSRRTDGFAFNQRYLLELVPLVAVAFAWAVTPLLARRRAWLLGGLGGLAVVAVIGTWPPGAAIRQSLVLYVPLALALAGLAAWVAWRRRPAAGWMAAGTAVLLGACLGWSAGITLMDDLRASRGARGANLQRLEALRAVVPDHSALFAWWGQKDAAGPLQMDRDVVIVDPWMDQGESAGALADALLADGRRLFVVAAMPPEVARDIQGERQVHGVLRQPLPLVEIVPGDDASHPHGR